MIILIRPPLAPLAILLLIVVMTWTGVHGQTAKQAIAHRGASAYAPEHTAAAYKLAMEQKVDFVEQDLGVTKDSQLICIHDDTLERTTDVADIFPDRASADAASRTPGNMSATSTISRSPRSSGSTPESGSSPNSPAPACSPFRKPSTSSARARDSGCTRS